MVISHVSYSCGKASCVPYLLVRKSHNLNLRIAYDGTSPWFFLTPNLTLWNRNFSLQGWLKWDFEKYPLLLPLCSGRQSEYDLKTVKRDNSWRCNKWMRPAVTKLWICMKSIITTKVSKESSVLILSCHRIDTRSLREESCAWLQWFRANRTDCLHHLAKKMELHHIIHNSQNLGIKILLAAIIR